MDIFAGIDGLKPAPKKIQSLSEQRKQQDTQRSTLLSDLDLLSGAVPTAAQSSSKPDNRPSELEEDDVFGIFVSAPSKPSKTLSKQSFDAPSLLDQHNKPHSSGSGYAVSSYDNTKSAMNREITTRSPNNHRPDRSEASENIFRNGLSTGRAPKTTSASKYDTQIAQMVDMGFEAEDSVRALEAMDGSTRGAINWLMAEAQGLPLPEPARKTNLMSGLGGLASTDLSNLQNQASQFGASVFSKASSLLYKGRKGLEKAYNTYNGTEASPAGQPAWMRDKAKHDSRAAIISRKEGSLSGENGDFRDTNNRRASHEDDLRSCETSSNSASHQPEKPVRRADLFRQKLKERQKSASNKTVHPNREATSGANSASPEPAIDLLNITSIDSTTESSLSSTQSDMYTVSKELGSVAFKNGDYELAVTHYTSALSIIPEGNILRCLLLSNRSAALMNAGNLRAAFEDTEAGIKLLPQQGKGLTVEGKSMSDIWFKLVTRRGQIAESMEKFEIALDSWQLLLDNGYASPSVLAAKRRCNTALNPEAVAKAQQSTEEQQKSQPRKSQRRGWGTTGAQPTSAAGKEAVAKVKEQHKQQAEEEKQRDILRDKIGQRVDNWKKGKEGNLAALLSTLQDVLWSDCHWQPVNAADLVVPKKVKIVYMRAVAKTHPDKVLSTAPIEVRMISQSVFVTLQSAWDKFRQQNNM